MAYATVADMTTRFGETEMIRLSIAAGAPATAVNTARVLSALESASAFVETYLRAQVPVPMAAPPLPVVDAVCDVARYLLAQGEGRVPTEQMKARRDETVSWLKSVARGEVQLADTVPAGAAQGGRFADREKTLSTSSLKGYV